LLVHERDLAFVAIPRLLLDGMEEDESVILETEPLAPKINFQSSMGRLIQMF
jgi:hypothetical protein